MEISFVSEEVAQKARELERRFQALPASAQILFVSVKPIRTSAGEAPALSIVLGLSRKIDPSSGHALARVVLAEDFNQFSISTQVFCGASGAARDEGNEGAGEASA